MPIVKNIANLAAYYDVPIEDQYDTLKKTNADYRLLETDHFSDTQGKWGKGTTPLGFKMNMKESYLLDCDLEAQSVPPPLEGVFNGVNFPENITPFSNKNWLFMYSDPTEAEIKEQITPPPLEGVFNGLNEPTNLTPFTDFRWLFLYNDPTEAEIIAQRTPPPLEGVFNGLNEPTNAIPAAEKF